MRSPSPAGGPKGGLGLHSALQTARRELVRSPLYRLLSYNHCLVFILRSLMHASRDT